MHMFHPQKIFRRLSVILLLLPIYSQGVARAADTPEGFVLEKSAVPVVLARDGQALLPIVIAPGASELSRERAAELAAYLQRLTGAEFQIQEHAEARGLTIGTLSEFPDPGLREALAMNGHYDGLEAFVIRTDAGHIRLLGNTEQGVSHAVFRFLELLGCRWYFMGENWEIIPERPELSFNLNENSRPAMLQRHIWFDRLGQKGEDGDPDLKEVYAAWQRRNRMGNSLNVKILHRWHAIPADFKAEFAAHPEYFALTDYRAKDGAMRRTAPQFCVTNPGLQDIIIRDVQNWFAANPDEHMVSLDPADTGGWCKCEECRKLGAHSTQPFYLANIAARALAETHPEKYVGLLAYSWYSDPPAFSLEPNVYVQLTRGFNASEHTFDNLFRMWGEKCRGISIYEYYSYWEMDKCMLPGNSITDLHNTAKTIRDYVASNVNGISAQSSCNWGIHGLGYYAANRLMWSPGADVDALRADFLQRSFGPAAAQMGLFYDLVNAGNSPLPGMNLLHRAAMILQEAGRLAAADPAVTARIDDLKKTVVYSFIGEKIDLFTYGGGGDREQELELALEWLSWAYRIRNSYMIPWITFRSTFGRPIAQKLKEPRLFWRNTLRTPELSPWRDDRPVTSAELEEKIAMIIRESGGVPEIDSPGYSNKYVLVAPEQIRAASQPRKIVASVLGTYLLYSVNGEPLEFTLEQTETSITRPDAVYVLSDLDGHELRRGQVPVGVHELKLEVPAAGAYHLSCHSRGRGYELKFPASLAGALFFEKSRTYRPSGYMEPLYFYVPLGIKEVIFYAHRCGTVVMRDGGGNIVSEAQSDGRIVAVPVPPGRDGQVWQIGDSIRGPGANMRLRRFSFLNLPNVLSFRPNRLFVPAEVAEKDRLPRFER